MSCLVDGMKVVGKMVALREDGSPVAIVWIVFEGEDEGTAEAFELARDGRSQVRLVPCELGKLADWQRLAALTGPEGG